MTYFLKKNFAALFIFYLIFFIFLIMVILAIDSTSLMFIVKKSLFTLVLGIIFFLATTVFANIVKNKPYLAVSKKHFLWTLLFFCIIGSTDVGYSLVSLLLNSHFLYIILSIIHFGFSVFLLTLIFYYPFYYNFSDTFYGFKEHYASNLMISALCFGIMFLFIKYKPILFLVFGIFIFILMEFMLYKNNSYLSMDNDSLD